MKKLIFIIVLCIPFLSSCWDRVEMQDLSIITAVAIDQVEEGKVKISAQIFIPRAITSGAAGEDPSTAPTFVREGVGDSLASAITMLQLNIPRDLFWGHCKIFIFGRSLAEQGIREEMDYLVRHPGPRGGSYVYVSEGEGAEILGLIPPLERYSGEALKKITQDALGMITTVRDVDMDLVDEGQSTALPLIKVLKSEEKAREPHETIPVIDGAAVFKKDKMVGTLDFLETNGLIWLKRSVKNSTLSIKPEGEKGGEITMTPTIGKVKFNPRIENNQWFMNLKLRVEGDIVQNETHLNLLNEAGIMKLEKEFEAVLKKQIADTIEKLQKQAKADVIGFGQRFHRKYPQEWKGARDHWEDKFGEVKFHIDVDANIRRPGYIGPPAALPFDEVKEE